MPALPAWNIELRTLACHDASGALSFKNSFWRLFAKSRLQSLQSFAYHVNSLAFRLGHIRLIRRNLLPMESFPKGCALATSKGSNWHCLN